jgi:hypothetical protein
VSVALEMVGFLPGSLREEGARVLRGLLGGGGGAGGGGSEEAGGKRQRL